jgi:hypothetical protein
VSLEEVFGIFSLEHDDARRYKLDDSELFFVPEELGSGEFVS